MYILQVIGCEKKERRKLRKVLTEEVCVTVSLWTNIQDVTFRISALTLALLAAVFVVFLDPFRQIPGQYPLFFCKLFRIRYLPIILSFDTIGP
jgi:hypothetical protein